MSPCYLGCGTPWQLQCAIPQPKHALPVRLSHVSLGLPFSDSEECYVPGLGSVLICDMTLILTQVKVGQKRHQTSQIIWVTTS